MTDEKAGYDISQKELINSLGNMFPPNLLPCRGDYLDRLIDHVFNNPCPPDRPVFEPVFSRTVAIEGVEP